VPKRDRLVTPPGESAERSDNRYTLFPATYWAICRAPTKYRVDNPNCYDG